MRKGPTWLHFLAIIGTIVTSAQGTQLEDLAAAIHNGETKAVDAILKASPQLVSQSLDKENNTALISAVQDVNKELVQLILTYSPAKKDQQAALATAMEQKNSPGEQGDIDEIIEMLLKQPETLAAAGDAESAQILNDFWQQYPICNQQSKNCKMGRMGKHWTSAQRSKWFKGNQWQAGRAQWLKNKEVWKKQHPEFQGKGSGHRGWKHRGGQAPTGAQQPQRQYGPAGKTKIVYHGGQPPFYTSQ